MNLFKWIEKKDLIYWLTIMIMIWLLTSNYDVTLSKWSFAGTIISIILAVLAIIYSFDQSSTTLYSTRKLEESSEKLEETSKNIENVSAALKNTTFDDLFLKLEQKIESLNTTFDERMKNNLSEHHDHLIEKLLNTNTKISGATNIDVFSKDEWLKILDKAFLGHPQLVYTLVYPYLSYKKGLRVDYVSLVRELFKTADKETLADIACTLNGGYLVFVNLEVFSTEIKDTKMINFVSKNLSEAIEPLIEQYKDSKFIADIIKMVNNKESH